MTWAERIRRGAPVRGWRLWILDPDGYLISPLFPIRWPGPVMRARQYDPNNNSGIHLADSLATLVYHGWGAEAAQSHYVYGLVRCLPDARYILHARGARCEAVLVERLWAAATVPAELHLALAQRYDCDVHRRRTMAWADPSVRIGVGVILGRGAVLGPDVVLGAGVVIGDGAIIEPHAMIGPRSQIGCAVRIGARAQIGAECVVADYAQVGAAAYLGAGVGVPRGVWVPEHEQVMAQRDAAKYAAPTQRPGTEPRYLHVSRPYDGVAVRRLRAPRPCESVGVSC